MSKWRHAKISNVAHVVPDVPRGGFGCGAVTFTVTATHDLPSAIETFSSISPNVTVVGVSGKWSAYCDYLTRGINSAFVISPAEVTVDNSAEGVCRAWSEDFNNLGRDFNHVISWNNDRRKQAD